MGVKLTGNGAAAAGASRYTHMMGNPNCRPTIELMEGSVVQFALAASKDFEGAGVDNFYHQIQNTENTNGFLVINFRPYTPTHFYLEPFLH